MQKRIAVFVLLLLGCGSGTLLADETLLPSAIGAEMVDLSLQQVENLASRRNRELAASRRGLEAAQADAISAAQRPNPTLSINTASINPHTGVGKGGLWEKHVDTIIRVDQLFERGDKRGLRQAAAAQGIEAGRADLADNARQLVSGIASAYFDLLLAQQREAVSRESVGLYRGTLDAAEKRLRAGDVSPTDVARVSVDALRAENDMRQSRADVLKAQATLAYMIGMEAESSRIRASDSWPPISRLAPMPDLETLLESRPDVKAARARSYMAEKTRDLARAQRSRDVTVGVQYEHFPPDNRNMLGVGISIPIFANYEYAGEIRRAEVDRMAAEDNLERVIALARTDSTRTRADVESASDRVRRYHGTILDQARKAAAAAEFAYRHGALGVMDLLDARRTLKATLLDAATAEAEYAKALVAWQSAITVNAKEEK